MLVTQQPVLRKFWYALVPMTDLDQGPQSFTLLNTPLVLWKQADGQPAALLDRCCHRTAKLSKGFVTPEGHIACGYHGWEYDCRGACRKVPQNTDGTIPPGAGVTAFHCQERYGYVWVALDDPIAPIPDFPEDGDPAYRRIFQFYEHWATSPLRVMENSFDNSHFSFVHKANFGIFDQPAPSKYNIEETDYGFQAETLVPINNPPESYRITGTTEPITHRHLINRWYQPFCRRFGCSYPASGIDHIIYNCATPIDDGHMVLVQWLYRNDQEANCSTQELINWDRAITTEDKEILEATDPDACIDLGRHAEFHMHSDRPGILMRRKLMQLLESHGEKEVFRSA